uniref:Chemokine interleukin-8-like domain-containing protein n=1 Tax=Astyanax mexicanus TaxID=7994 RepID=A0A3B1IX32_ASTMX
PTYLSIYLSIIYLSIYYLSIYSIYLSIYLSTYLPTFLLIHLPTYLPTYLPETRPDCPRAGVIFITRKGLRVCVNPNLGWVQKVRGKIDWKPVESSN